MKGKFRTYQISALSEASLNVIASFRLFALMRRFFIVLLLNK